MSPSINASLLYGPTGDNGLCFATCTASYCACLGPLFTFDESQGTCDPSHAIGASHAGDTTCGVVDQCVRSFTVCVAMVALEQYESPGTSPVTCQEWAGFFALPLLAFVRDNSSSINVSQSFAKTGIFSACKDYTCEALANVSTVLGADCPPWPELDCPAPLTPMNGNTGPSAPPAIAIPTGPDGSSLVPAAKFTGTLRIAGDFTKFFAAAQTSLASYKAMLVAASNSIRNLTGGYNVSVTNVSSGSLVVPFTLTVPATVQATIETIFQAAVANPSSNWLSDIQTVYRTYYPNGYLSSAVVITFSVQSLAAMGATPTSGTACSAGCVAGVVIGCIGFVAVAAFVVITWNRGPTGRKQRPRV